MSHTKLARSRLNALSKYTTITTFCDYCDGHARWGRSKWLPRTFVQASAAAAGPVHRHRRRHYRRCLSRTVWTSLRQTSNTTTASFITDFNEVYYTVSSIHLLRWLIQIQTQSPVLIYKAECSEWLCESEYVYVFVRFTKSKKHRYPLFGLLCNHRSRIPILWILSNLLKLKKWFQTIIILLLFYKSIKASKELWIIVLWLIFIWIFSC